MKTVQDIIQELSQLNPLMPAEVELGPVSFHVNKEILATVEIPVSEGLVNTTILTAKVQEILPDFNYATHGVSYDHVWEGNTCVMRRYRIHRKGLEMRLCCMNCEG